MASHHVEWENYGKSSCLMTKLWKIIMFNGETMDNHQFLMGKSTISMAVFNGYVSLGKKSATLKHTHVT